MLRLLTHQDLTDEEVMRNTRFPLEVQKEPLGWAEAAAVPWREDITRGTSLDSDLHKEYLSMQDDTMEILAPCGSIPGFVVFPRTNLCSSEELMRELERELDQEDGLVLGEAESSRFYYLDLLAWNLKAAQKTAARLLKDHGVPWACWHSFYFLDRTMELYK